MRLLGNGHSELDDIAAGADMLETEERADQMWNAFAARAAGRNEDPNSYALKMLLYEASRHRVWHRRLNFRITTAAASIALGAAGGGGLLVTLLQL